jgi:hypothetical protein
MTVALDFRAEIRHNVDLLLRDCAPNSNASDLVDRWRCSFYVRRVPGFCVLCCSLCASCCALYCLIGGFGAPH